VVSFRGAHINYSPVVEPRIATVYKKTFPNINAFHAVSEAICKEAEQYGANSNKVKVIHSPIPTFFFSQFSDFSKPKTEIINVISVGRLHWKKGFRYAIDAISILRSKGYNIYYTILGPSEITEEILFQIHDLGLKDVITIKASVNQKELINYLKTQDLLLLSSLEEGIANVILESMAVGLPVISTNCGGMAEVVKHKETGWLVPFRDPIAIADAVVDIMQTTEPELQRITQNAHDFVKAHFNAENSINEFLELYDKVMMDGIGVPNHSQEGNNNSPRH
jgi:colanic acid/amylovoran biosynthesis glycosyltransferase